jgi:hypothetical protein
MKLLPARYVRAYVKRNKTDAADAADPSWTSDRSMRVILRSLFPRGAVRFFRRGFFYSLND